MPFVTSAQSTGAAQTESTESEVLESVVVTAQFREQNLQETPIAINTNRVLIPGYTLANARSTWRNSEDDLEASFQVTNLFDKYYYLTSFEISAAAGLGNAQPGRPREWAVTLKKDF